MKKLFVLAFVLAATLSFGAPKALAVDAPYLFGKSAGAGQVRLWWAPVPGASYQVFYGPKDNPMAHGVVVGEGGSVTVGGLFKSTAYVFTAKSLRNDEVSGLSNRVVVRTRAAGRKHLPNEEQMTQASATGVINPPAVKFQGTMRTNAALNPASETTGRQGVGRHNLRAVTGPHQGQVTLFWNHPNELVSSYNVVYSDTPDMDKWGVLDISGDARSFTVGALTPRKRYYFKVSGNNTELSPWVSELAR